MLRWRTPSYESDRRIALSGHVEVGAVFPPLTGVKWRWRLWVCDSVVGNNGEELTELAAKIALDRKWAGFLMRANLAEMAP